MNDNTFSYPIGRRSILAAGAAVAFFAAVARAPDAVSAQQQPQLRSLDDVLKAAREAAAQGKELVRPETLPPRWQNPPAGDQDAIDKQVIDVANAIIQEMRLDAQEQYSILGRPDKVTHAPMLVENQDGTPQYYIVLYGLPDELPRVRVAVRLDAKTGVFDGVTAFGRPMRFLTPQEARNAVAAALPPDLRDAVQNAQVTSISRPTGPRSVPFWQVKIGDRVFNVDQDGSLYGKVEPGLGGN